MRLLSIFFLVWTLGIYSVFVQKCIPRGPPGRQNIPFLPVKEDRVPPLQERESTFAHGNLTSMGGHLASHEVDSKTHQHIEILMGWVRLPRDGSNQEKSGPAGHAENRTMHSPEGFAKQTKLGSREHSGTGFLLGTPDLHVQSGLGTRLQFAVNTRLRLLRKIFDQQIYKLKEVFS